MGGDLEGIEKLGTGAFRRAAVEGNTVESSVMSGQIVGLVKEELPCETIILQLMEETKEVIDKYKRILSDE